MIRRTLVLAAALAALGSAPAAALEPGRYEGTTDHGEPITFTVAGGKLRAIDALIPTSCVSTLDDTPRAGREFFRPPGAFAVGATRTAQALQESAMHYNDVTKHYRVTLKRLKRGAVRATLHVNFSYQALDYSGWDGPRLAGWVCRGDDSFRVR